MRVFALLSWFDEDPEHLGRCVRSLAGFADVLVAVDGAYATFPGGGRISPASNWAAVAVGCEDAGLEFWPHHPYLPAWDSEVAKRAAMFEFGRGFGATADDWFLVIDADEVLGTYLPDARALLATTDRDVAEVRYCGVQIDGVVHHTSRERRLYRALPGLTVERAHYLYVVPCGCDGFYRDAPCVAGRRFLWRTPDGHISGEPALDLFGSVTMHHYNSGREPSRRQRALDYYKARDAAGLEAVGRDWTGLGELA